MLRYPFLYHHLFFNVFLPSALLAALRRSLGALQRAPASAIKAFSDFDQVGPCSNPKSKSDIISRPPVKMGGQGKVRIPPQADNDLNSAAPALWHGQSMALLPDAKHCCPEQHLGQYRWPPHARVRVCEEQG
jgi:hypothetical protein